MSLVCCDCWRERERPWTVCVPAYSRRGVLLLLLLQCVGVGVETDLADDAGRVRLAALETITTRIPSWVAVCVYSLLPVLQAVLSGRRCLFCRSW